MTVDRGGTWHFTNFPNTAALDAMAGPEGIRFLDRPPPGRIR